MTPTAFNKYASQGNQFLNQLSDELDFEGNTTKTLRLLRAVLHTIRNHISPEESVHFMAQLPMALKAIYVDGWKIRHKPARLHALKDFDNEVFELSGGYNSGIFKKKEDVERYVSAVMDSLSRYISRGEMADVAVTLPPQLRLYFEPYVMEGKSVFY